MKKLLIAVLTLGLSSSAFAACDGPYCADDKGAQITAGLNLVGMTVAQMNQRAPGYVGQLVYVTDGLQAKICISSGTTNGAYTLLTSTGVFASGDLGHCN